LTYGCHQQRNHCKNTNPKRQRGKNFTPKEKHNLLPRWRFGLVSRQLGFLTLIAVSLLTKKNGSARNEVRVSEIGDVMDSRM